MRFHSINLLVVAPWALCVGALGCEPSPGPAPSPDVMVVERDATAETGALYDTGSDTGPIGRFVGEWSVSNWTLTRAIGGSFPNPADGGTENAECARVVRDSYRIITLRVDARTSVVRVNAQECAASVSEQDLSVSCPCGVPTAQVCGHALTLRLDTSGMLLTGEERFDFSYTSPAYCTAAATFEARQTRAP